MHLRYFYLETVVIVQCPGGVCVAVHIRWCRGHAVRTSASATCSLHVTVFPLVAACAARSGFHPCAYADASPGFGSIVGREFANHLGHVSWCQFLRGTGATRNFGYILF